MTSTDTLPTWATGTVTLDGSTYYTRETSTGLMAWTVCERCGGSGHYSFNPLDGTVCYGCRGNLSRLTGQAGRWEPVSELERKATNRIKARARRERKAAAFAAGEAARWEALVAARPLLAELTYLPDYAGILGSMRGQFERKGTLSPAQVEFAEKIIREGMETTAREEAKAAQRAQEDADAQDAPAGKVTITGRVATIRWEDNPFDPRGGQVCKWLIVTDAGWKAWGSVPAAARRAEVAQGDRVTFTADVAPSAKDPKFAIASRPSGFRVLAD